jgi:hypothetical protein
MVRAASTSLGDLVCGPKVQARLEHRKVRCLPTEDIRPQCEHSFVLRCSLTIHRRQPVLAQRRISFRKKVLCERAPISLLLAPLRLLCCLLLLPPKLGEVTSLKTWHAREVHSCSGRTKAQDWQTKKRG